MGSKRWVSLAARAISQKQREIKISTSKARYKAGCDGTPLRQQHGR